MSRICQVDSFYVGFFKPNSTVSFPYSWDDGRYDDPETLTYAQDGLCSWIQRTASIYEFQNDDGALISRGQRFGQLERPSRDALVVPLVDMTGESRRAIGMVGMLSYSPRIFNEPVRDAFKLLASSVVVWLQRSQEDRVSRAAWHLEDDETLRWDPVTSLAERYARGLAMVRDRLETLRRELPPEASFVHDEVTELIDLCEEIPTELAEVALRPTSQLSLAWQQLSARERKVAQLIRRNLSNDEIAGELGISVSTVKKHVTQVLEAFDVSQRVGIIERLRGMDL